MQKDLPIGIKEKEIIAALECNQVVVVVGETGSGKTTGIPEMVYRAGFARNGKIGVTEPRKIAAISVARFVDSQIRRSGVVGYQVRFDKEVGQNTRIKFMTDGILLREFQRDPDLRQYAVIMIDEAHERSVNIDFTLGLLKDLLKRRTDLKVIVASATIDQEKFSQYFGGAPIINVSCRMYPVEIRWSSANIFGRDMIGAIVRKVEEIHRSNNPGDILVFMSGEEDIRQAAKEIGERSLSNLVTIPLYGALSYEEQERALGQFPGVRKVVIATNIAETSLTIDGIVHVVDSGLIKQSNFHPERGIRSLDVVPHSQAGCNQRAGRAGRTQAGICHRMYTEQDFDARLKFTEPEIRRSSLASVVLSMEDIGIDDIESFDFIDAPDRQAFHEAYETLIALGAISKGKKGLTEIGRAMAELPLEPSIARMLLEADVHKCVGPVCAIAAFLSVRNILVRPEDKKRDADTAHSRFRDPRSDLLGYLKVWDAYEASGYSSRWARDNFLNAKGLREVEQVGNQLANILEDHGIEISVEGSEEQVLKAVASGLIHNLCRFSSRHTYGMATRESYHGVFIHPSSALFSAAPQWLVAAEIAETSKVFARGCSTVKTAWLPEIAPHVASFGSTQITEVLPDRQGVTARREIIFKETPVGFMEVQLSLEEAHELQKTAARKAEEKGWIRLTFKEPEQNSWSSRFIAESGGKKYESTRWGVRAGVSYYCQVVPPPFALTRSEYINVEPMLALLDLPPLKEQPVPETRQEAQAPKGPLDLGRLAEKWGASVRV
jgi:RNA helicase HrpA